jgi:hypothetical protein
MEKRLGVDDSGSHTPSGRCSVLRLYNSQELLENALRAHVFCLKALKNSQKSPEKCHNSALNSLSNGRANHYFSAISLNLFD